MRNPWRRTKSDFRIEVTTHFLVSGVDAIVTVVIGQGCGAGLGARVGGARRERFRKIAKHIGIGAQAKVEVHAKGAIGGVVGQICTRRSRLPRHRDAAQRTAAAKLPAHTSHAKVVSGSNTIHLPCLSVQQTETIMSSLARQTHTRIDRDLGSRLINTDASREKDLGFLGRAEIEEA